MCTLYCISYFHAVQWVRNTSGKQLAVVDGFTYYLGARATNTCAWRCTKGKLCRARFTLDKNKKMIRFNLLHDHPAPTFIIRDDVYIKV